jgi:hypothetical protein
MRRSDFLKALAVLPFVRKLPALLEPEPEKDYGPGFIGRLVRAAAEYTDTYGERPRWFTASRETMAKVWDEEVNPRMPFNSLDGEYHAFIVHGLRWYRNDLLEMGDFLLWMEKPRPRYAMDEMQRNFVAYGRKA